MAPPRKNTSVLWAYFDKHDVYNKRAQCNACQVILSYKSTTANLKNHLKRKHYESYASLKDNEGNRLIRGECRKYEPFFITVLSRYCYDNTVI